MVLYANFIHVSGPADDYSKDTLENATYSTGHITKYFEYYGRFFAEVQIMATEQSRVDYLTRVQRDRYASFLWRALSSDTPMDLEEFANNAS